MQKVKAKERKVKKLITNWFLRNLNEIIIQVVSVLNGLIFQK